MKQTDDKLESANTKGHVRSSETGLEDQQGFRTSIHQIQSESLRWPALEGLRGLAILLVFVVHYTSFLKPHMARHGWSLEMAAVTAKAGQSGVDLFFVLSGLLIYRICIQEKFEARKYARRRFVRIYPTFLFVFAMYICAMLAYPLNNKFAVTSGHGVLYILSNLLLLPGLFPIVPIITVAWSLSYELAYYIAMPILRLGLRLHQWSSLQRFILAITAVTLMIVTATLGFGPNLHMIMFLAGILVYELGTGFGAYMSFGAGSLWMDLLLFAVLISTVFTFGFQETRIWHVATLGALHQRVIDYVGLTIAFSLLVYECLFKRAAAYAIFSWYPLRWLGKISYSFYLFHALILQGCFRALNALLPNYQVGCMGYLLLLPVVLLVAVVLTWPLFAFVEKPFSLGELSTRAAPAWRWKQHSVPKSVEKTLDSDGEDRHAEVGSVGPRADVHAVK